MEFIDGAKKTPGNIGWHKRRLAVINEAEKLFTTMVPRSQLAPGLGGTAATAHDDNAFGVADLPAQLRAGDKEAHYFIREGGDTEGHHDAKHRALRMARLKIQGEYAGHYPATRRQAKSGAKQFRKAVAVKAKLIQAFFPKNGKDDAERCI